MFTYIHLPEGSNRKKVLIIGDAVSEGMSGFYKQLLSGFMVHRLSTDCAVTDKNYVHLLDFSLLAAQQRYDVICFTPSIDYNEKPEILQQNIKAAAERIKKTHPLAKLVFVALTAVDAQIAGKDKNFKIYGCNKALELLAAELGASFVDLWTLSERILSDHTNDGVLFTDMGYKKLAFEAVKYIK